MLLTSGSGRNRSGLSDSFWPLVPVLFLGLAGCSFHVLVLGPVLLVAFGAPESGCRPLNSWKSFRLLLSRPTLVAAVGYAAQRLDGRFRLAVAALLEQVLVRPVGCSQVGASVAVLVLLFDDGIKLGFLHCCRCQILELEQFGALCLLLEERSGI